MCLKMKIRMFHKLARCIELSQEVKNALEIKKAVVALESTIITHGMPYPVNLETALAVEQIIRDEAAIPATVGIIGGKLRVGLSSEEIHYLAAAKHPVKTSRRDLPYVLSKGLEGGTTVSGTMIAANSVGIKVFVTGGIGGVHRQGENTMDISADLTELSKTPVAVICSGIKSILDIGRSLEYLETQGVCVATYGTSRQFPAFYCRSSGFQSPHNVASPQEAAELIRAAHHLQLQSGLVIAVPIPEEYQLLDEKTMENSIYEALNLAKKANIKGKAVTPFILEQLAKLTGGKSLQSNIALIKNNASVGAKIAVALAASLRESRSQSTKKSKEDVSAPLTVFAKPRKETLHPVVVGASMLDSIVSVKDPFKVEERTLKGQIRQSGGGVGRNIADALGKLGAHPLLISAVGDDLYGRFLLHQTISHLDHSGVLVSTELPTASYSVLLDSSGTFRMGVGDMDMHSLILPDHISKHLHNPSAVIIDGNIPAASTAFILEHCSHHGIPVIFEPTDVSKAAIPFQFESWKSLRLITPNIKELRKIASFIGVDVNITDKLSETSIEEAVSLAMPLAQHIQTVMVTLGPLGVLMVGHEEAGAPVTARYYACKPLESVVSVSGAGDCLAAAVVKGLLAGVEEPQCIAAGFAAAYDSLHHYAAVPPQFTSSLQPAQYSLIDSEVKHTQHH